MSTTRAGDLGEKVGFYKPVEADDGYGNVTSGIANTPAFSPVAAAIEPKLGGESVLAGRLTGTNFVNITVRTSANTLQIDTSWSARDERAGINYNIRSIIDPNQGTQQRGRFLELLCERGVAA